MINKEKIIGFVDGFQQPKRAEPIPVNPVKTNKFILQLDNSEDFFDGSILSYTDHELSDEQLRAINNYFTQ